VVTVASHSRCALTATKSRDRSATRRRLSDLFEREIICHRDRPSAKWLRGTVLDWTGLDGGSRPATAAAAQRFSAPGNELEAVD